MRTEDAVKYVTSAPQKVSAALTAVPALVNATSRKLTSLPQETFSRVDKTIHHVISKDKELRNIALKNGTYRDRNNSEMGPALQPLGADKQTRLMSQRTEMTKRYKTENEAKENFRYQSEQLLRPGSWNGSSTIAPAWDLFDSQGQPETKDRHLQKGDVLRIDVPGPDFFVKADRVNVSKDNVQFTLRPTVNPALLAGSQTTHFFTDKATRTFALQRDGQEVRFVTSGNNETINALGQSGVWKAPWNIVNGLGVYATGEAYWNTFGDQLLNNKF